MDSSADVDELFIHLCIKLIIDGFMEKTHISIADAMELRLFCIKHRMITDGLMQKRRNSIANAMELHIFCIKPSNYELLYDCWINWYNIYIGTWMWNT